jgi:hypothetical protein
VQVDPPVSGGRQERLTNQAAVRDDDTEVGFERGDPLTRRGVESVGPDRVDPQLRGRGGHRRRGDHTLAAHRRIAARDSGQDLVVGCREPAQ